MVTLADDEGEAERLAELRASRGPGVPLVAVASVRLNLPATILDACDAILVPRLVPAADHPSSQTLEETEARPTIAWVRLPLAVGDEGPFAEIDAIADDQLAMPLVLSNGVILGGQGRVKDLGVTVVVVTDFDIALARNLADDLAEAVWSRRTLFTGEVPGRDSADRPRPMWPFEPDAAWVGETFGV